MSSSQTEAATDEVHISSLLTISFIGAGVVPEPIAPIGGPSGVFTWDSCGTVTVVFWMLRRDALAADSVVLLAQLMLAQRNILRLIALGDGPLNRYG